MNRSAFLKQSALIAAGIGITKSLQAANVTATNKLPKWKGFNLLDFFTPGAIGALTTKEEHFKWMQDWGFDFVRIPIAYPSYLEFDRSRNITPDEVYHISNAAVEKIDTLVAMAHKYNMHVSLNLHRAPGYCINAGFHEPYNLWKDDAAQQAFYFHWNMWAKRYKNVSPAKISFDLVNEPGMREDMNDQHSKVSAVPGEVYRKVAKAAAEAIRKENPQHLVIADGNNVGSTVITEITDLDIAQSCRGYNPGLISHYKAPWANNDPEHMPEPKWPGQVGNQYLSREMLEKFYEPWIALANSGVGVHCGECGCWNKTPHHVFLAWFTDLLDILSASKIGFAIWNFTGDFGVLDSGRTDVAYKDWYGHKLDERFLDVLKKA
ncbi:cellulase family glycosylhydrolase [Panacibacter sp. DH6]|uniref:Cellulase family glycosylhydrolase n=1 Tax=Panacibacter microcysteis TaxID=2793269 RepID=A0A931GZK1_9BACT|nr:cellulase family glycosylhydrolase [Panacibacter microcysteis]MBG9378270.1 cellulase family glycosylhydrolase [Panacibacter microcysteis]